jgi:hypothetical protein
MVLSKAELKSMVAKLLADLAAVGPAHAQVALFVNDITPGPLTALADMTEPTYPGYARQDVTASGPYEEPDGSQWLHLADVTFQMGDSTAPTTIIGAFVVTQAGALVLAGRLPAPVQLLTAAQALVLSADPKFPVGADTGAWLVET